MGDLYTTTFESDQCLIILPEPFPPLTPPGSFRFYDVGCALTTSESVDWAVGTGDFTVEWYQYQTATASADGNNQYQRVFTVNTYPSASMAISIELGSMYVWMANRNTSSAQIPLSNVIDQWVHFAFVRRSGAVNVYQQGTSISNFTNNNDINDAMADMHIGAEPTDDIQTKFQGFITNLHFVKGQALYTASFAIPTGSIAPTANTKLLLNTFSANTYLRDYSGLDRVVINEGAASWDQSSPYHS